MLSMLPKNPAHGVLAFRGFSAQQNPACESRDGCENEEFVPNSRQETHKTLDMSAGILAHSCTCYIELYAAHIEQENLKTGSLPQNSSRERMVDLKAHHECMKNSSLNAEGSHLSNGTIFISV
jgi:hypothetical protein